MKAKRILKKILIATFSLIIVAVLTLAAIPIFFKDKIVLTVKEEINKALNATVDFSDVDISLLSSFPSFNLSLKNLEVIGKEEFDQVKLAAIEDFEFNLGLMSVIKGDVPIQIESVKLFKPEVNVLVTKDGKANYDIVKASSPETESTQGEIKISLQNYSIEEGKIVYDDRLGDVYLAIDNLNHSGTGDFTLDIFDLNTKTVIDGLTVKSGGIALLKKAKANLDAGFNIDMANSKYTLLENELLINDLLIKADGWVAMPNEDIDMDLNFETPQNNFKNLLSMIPNAYIEGYEQVKANGEFQLNGNVKGIYSTAPERYPSFKINLDVNNGDVQYPDLPLGISNIVTKVLINSPSSNLNDLLVDVSSFNLKLGNNPFGGFFKLKTPLSDPDINTQIKGILNLEEFSKAFPMDGIDKLEGVIESDVSLKAKLSQIEREAYEQVDMRGDLTAKDIDYLAEGLPEVKINTLQMDFSPQAATVKTFDSQLGKSDIKASGKINNLLAYFSPDKTMTGNFTVRSNYFNADEWMVEDESASSATVATTENINEENIEIFDRFNFDIDAKIDEIDYDIYKIKNTSTKAEFSPSKLKVDNFSMDIGNSDLAGSGFITNIFNYVFKNETLGGALKLNSDFFDLNQFMVEEESEVNNPPTNPDELEPILVPENIDMKIDADFNKVRYTNIDLEDIKGQLLVANQGVEIKNMTANSMGGDMEISGGYHTKNPEKPVFDLDYNLQKLDFASVFEKFNTIQALAPIGKFIQGNFSSNLKMSSELEKDLMPDLSTLFADGFLHTFEAKLKNFPPLEAIGNKLNIEELKTIAIKSSKNWINVKDGKVLLQPFDYIYEEMEMKISGSHQLTGGMDYKVIAKIPREKINKNKIGAAANSGLEFLKGEASKLGFNLNTGKYVNVQINLTGDISKPKVGVKLLGVSGEGESLEDVVAETAKEEAEAVVEEVKQEAEEKIDTLITQTEEKIDKEIEDLTQQGKDILNEAGKGVVDSLGIKVGTELKDEGKKVLKDLFGKKKKKEGN